jgi:hypothetical protein
MTQQQRRDDQAPDSPADRDPAEGSREAAESNTGGGITNRSVGREQREQDELPPRGKRKDGSHA